MRKKILLLLFPLWIAACSTEEQPALNEPQPMRFAFYMKDGGKVSPMSRATAANLEETGISLYCSYHEKPFDNIIQGTDPACPHIYWDTPVDAQGNSKDGIPRFWMMSPSAYYTFWAHSDNPVPNGYPPTPNGTDKWGVTGGSGGTSDHQNAVCNFIQLDDPRQQIDLLVADQIKDMQAVYIAPVVGLYFSHLLSRVKIKFYNSQGTQLNNCIAKITYKENKVIRGFGMNLGESFYINMAGNITQHSGTYPLHDGTFTLPATITSPDYAFMAGDLILSPQKVDDGFITVSLNYTPEGKTTEEVATVEIPAPDPVTISNHSQTQTYTDTNTYLQRGYAYTYNINVIAETSSLKIGSVMLSSWEEQNSDTVDWGNY